MKNTVEKMPLEQKVELCSGKSFWETKTYEEWGIPSIFMADGPHGVRKQEDSEDMLGINRAVDSTCFPCACLSACSFDEALLEKMGRAIALEAKDKGVSVVLGPGVNIKRDPLCGRNFEYYSEDAFLSYEIGKHEVMGIEEKGVHVVMKHFALNDCEQDRLGQAAWLTEQAAREIYLKAFQAALKMKWVTVS